MAESPATQTQQRMPAGRLAVGVVVGALALVSLAFILIHRGLAKDWSSADTGLAVALAVAGLISAWVWGEPVAAVTPGDKPRTRAALGLAGEFTTAAAILILAVHRLINQPWGKADWSLAVLALAGVVIGVVIWWEPLVGSFSSRGTMLQINAGVVTLLVLGIIILVNFTIIPRHFGWVKADWTKEKYYSLADQTIKVVKGLKPEQAVEIIGIVPKDRFASRSDLQVMGKRLEEYQRLSPNLTVKVLDPYLDTEAAKLLREGVLSSDVGAVVRFKDHPEQREGVTSTEEADITRAILKLLNPSSRKLYFVKGHGEQELAGFEQGGLSTFKEVLTHDRYETADLELYKVDTVPDDAAAVLSIGPRLPFSADELQKLEAYLAKGGRLFACLDPQDDRSNLGELLSKYGIEWHPAQVTDSVNSLSAQDTRAFASTGYSDHEAVKLFQQARGYMVWFFGAGYFTEQPGEFEVKKLVETSSSSYAEMPQPKPAPAAGQGGAKAAEPEADGGAAERTNGPLAVAMCSSTKDEEKPADDQAADKDKDKAEDKAAPEAKKPRIRVAAFADGDFVSNIWQQAPVVNYQVAANTIAWLTDNTEVIGIRAKDPTKDAQERAIKVDEKGRKWLLVLTLLLPLVLIVAAGLTVRLARR